MKKTLTTLLFLVFNLILQAEPVCHFRHYSTEDGLPQYTIMDMLQDRNGFMWFGTWDGLSKFDGYRFHNYKVRPGETYFMRSNRIERIYDDRYGRIWFKSYDGEIHCFNPNTRKFWGVQLVRDLQKNPFMATHIDIKPSGKVWLFSEKNGCILVSDSLFNTINFDFTTGNIKAQAVNAAIEDRTGNSWLLTDNGVWLVNGKNYETKPFFYENNTDNTIENQVFYAGLSTDILLYFGSDNGRVWRYNLLDGKFNLIQLPTQSSIKQIKAFNSQKLVAVTSSDGFIIFDPSGKKIEKFNRTNSPELKSDRIFEIFFTGNRYMWFDTENVGIYRFDFTINSLRYYHIETDDPATIVFPPRTMVFEDIKGRLWIQPKGGGFSLYNYTTEQLDPFFNSRHSGKWLFSNIIHSACSDIQGNLWMCTRSHGLEKVVFDQQFFIPLKINNEKNSVTANDVRCVFEDSKRNLWIATKDRRLTIYDAAGNRKGCLDASGNIVKDAFMPAMVYCTMEDDAGNLWFGTKGSGIFLLHNRQSDIKVRLEHFSNNPTDVYSLSDNSVYSIFQDSRKNIWIATYGGGLNLVKKNTDRKLLFISHRNNLKNYPVDTFSRLRFITENAQGKICVGSTAGLLMFPAKFDAPENITFKQYSRQPGNSQSLMNNDVHGICITRKGEMYLATFGGGLNKVTEFDKEGYPQKFDAFTTEDGLPSDVTLAVIEDEFGKLWITTENNLSKFDPEKEVFENFAEVKRMMVSSNFSEASTVKLQNNNMVFGFSDGIVKFSPAQIINSSYKPYIALSGFQLFNKNVEPGVENSPLTNDINALSRLKLKHNQNFITIEYAALDFVDPENILYAYKLEGLDENWNYVQKQRTANYTSLPKGKYVFKVKSTNSEGVWMDNERTLEIEVLPSFWQTIWAYLLYLFFFIGIVLLVVHILYTIYRLRGNVELEKKMSEMKLRFFTDISHEIRTPLTMITAPIDFLLNDRETPEGVKKHLKTIAQNTSRMLRLVNQILDFRKIQFLHLKVREVEISSIVQEICENFTEVSENQHVKLVFTNKTSDDKVWLDPDCLEKILMNLLSNAFKFTPSGKSIEVITYSDDKTVTVSVTDQGIGIPKEKQKNLFVRFASLSDDKSKPSTGIGLSLVKELVDKHAAKIFVDSDPGRGSTFSVSFQRGVAHFDKNVEILAAYTEEKNRDNESECAQVSIKQNELSSQNEKFSVLIVEDDNDLRSFIRSIIEKDYFVYEAADGTVGLELANEITPDFVVSDIMMPGMDGLELLQKLKTNRNTSHIPVVLLTSKTTIESKLEGLAYGADDYITKPFSVPYFQARISNLIQQRRLLNEIITSRMNIGTGAMNFNPEPFVFTSHDEEFMKKVLHVIEENMENYDFVVDDIAKETGMSRSVFFKKIKSLTGMAPIEFIREMKMKRAAQILISGQYMVKEVSYMVGISDTKYFAKCFRTRFGMTPMEYKNQHSESSKNQQ
jgi:signal transduction histidine kinase/DNA-binding response OmpR family regulator/ligand-binding sensor domain-containing protein